jgi:hypothetical protein
MVDESGAESGESREVAIDTERNLRFFGCSEGVDGCA